ncbi:MAG: 16S rRNA (uracil(1498)-N(3))-methyltransferase [Eubacteriales bacterium]
MRRFFIDAIDIQESNAFLRGAEFAHMTKVLRCKPGETFVLLDNTGSEYIAVLKDILEDHAVLTIAEKRISEAEPETQVILYQGMPKSQKLDTIVQKAVELGAISIVPFVSERCVKIPKDFDKKADRLKKIATEAVKQSRRAIVPSIGRLMDFKTLVKATSEHALALLCYEDEQKRSLKQILSQSNAKDIAVIIGPEGGFSPEEAAALADAGAASVTLGKRILRTETAGLAALAQIMYEKEQV